MNEVAGQFKDGMLQRLRIVPELANLEKAAVIDLCSAAIDAFRAGFDRPWQLSSLEDDLDARCPLPEGLKRLQNSRGSGVEGLGDATPSRKQVFVDDLTVYLADEDKDDDDDDLHEVAARITDLGREPAQTLLGLVLGVARLPLRRNAADFVSVAVAKYLDPFIDGEVAAPNRDSLRGQGCLERVLEAWKRRWATEQVAVGIPPQLSADCVLAQYLAHAICKMNVAFGFGEMVNGEGRSPASNYHAMKHIMLLGTQLVEAVERDFPRDAFGPSASKLRDVTAEQITYVAQCHLQGLHAYHHTIHQALTTANAEGEVGRKEERVRIWGPAFADVP